MEIFKTRRATTLSGCVHATALLWAFPSDLSSQFGATHVVVVEVWLQVFWCDMALLYNNAVISLHNAHPESARYPSVHRRLRHK